MKHSLSLSLQIVTVLLISLAVVLTATTMFSIRTQTMNLEEAVQVSAERASNFAKQALSRSMEENNVLEIRKTIRSLTAEPGIVHIRVYDKSGTICYSDSNEEVGHRVDVEAEACVMCHGKGATEFTKTSTDQYVRTYEGPSGRRTLGFINPIKNEPQCWNADCHAHEPEQTILGVLDVQMSLENVDRHIDDSILQLLLSALVTLLAVAAASVIFIYFGVHKPVTSVIAGTREIASGNLKHRIPVRRADEIGHLAESFNRMAADLDAARDELLDWSNTLEQKVAQKSSELQSIQEQVVHMEKMASLGKLSSMIAHELNNPLSGILTLAKLARKRIGDSIEPNDRINRIQKDLEIIADEAKRCGDIVRNLLFFARAHPQSRKECDLNAIIERSLRLVQHQIVLQQIVVSYTPDLPLRVYCDESQLQQVLIALLINAIEAMPDGGTLRIAATLDESSARLSVTDTGVGISSADMQRLFEPFFTTKESGFGTGLGLSIVFGIVKQHGGDIRVDSAPGQGSTFTIILPQRTDTDIQPPETAA